MKEKIDFVILWVDGSDPEWLKEKNKYSETKIDIDDSVARYRDMKTLKYWFRGVEKYTPWVNKIHFITWGHVPEWLDINNPKLNIVKHSDYIPKEYLPTFNACTIELNLFRIKELSEKFVLFNDDVFVLNDLTPSYFFKKGLPCDCWREDCFKTEDAGQNFFDHVILNNLFLINKNINKKRAIKSNINKIFNIKYGKRNLRSLMLQKWKYFCGFSHFHTANAFLKSNFKKMWELEYDFFNESCLSRFRGVNNINQWAILDYQLVTGQFTVKSYNDFGKYFVLGKDNEQIVKYINDKKATVICINDTSNSINFDESIKMLINIFEKKLPHKSSFEK